MDRLSTTEIIETIIIVVGFLYVYHKLKWWW
jgi:hypothetical protein